MTTTYATLPELKRLLGVSASADDALLTEILVRATAHVDAYTRRHFVSASGTRVTRSVSGDAALLPDDILSVSKVTNGDGTEIALTDITTISGEYPARALVWRYGNFTAPVSVEGVWGYSAVPPADIVHAALRLAAWMYRQKDAQVFDVSGTAEMRMTIRHELPSDVISILDKYTWWGWIA